MNEKASKGGWWTPIKVGLFLTALVLICFVAMALRRNCVLLDTGALECQSNWAWFFTSRPNEIGDTLAGFAGTLAFIWIVVTVWLQSSELAEQRKVLREQKEEFKLMVAAQDAQVKALEAQAIIFEDEKRRRDEDVSRQYISRIVRSIVSTIKYSMYLQVAWRPVLKENDNESEFLRVWGLIRLEAPPSDIEDAFLFFGRQIIDAGKSLASQLENPKIRIIDSKSASNLWHDGFMRELSRLRYLCDEAVSARAAASTIEHELLAHLNIDEIRNSIADVERLFQERFE